MSKRKVNVLHERAKVCWCGLRDLPGYDDPELVKAISHLRVADATLSNNEHDRNLGWMGDLLFAELQIGYPREQVKAWQESLTQAFEQRRDDLLKLAAEKSWADAAWAYATQSKRGLWQDLLDQHEVETLDFLILAASDRTGGVAEALAHAITDEYLFEEDDFSSTPSPEVLLEAHEVLEESKGEASPNDCRLFLATIYSEDVMDPTLFRLFLPYHIAFSDGVFLLQAPRLLLEVIEKYDAIVSSERVLSRKSSKPSDEDPVVLADLWKSGDELFSNLDVLSEAASLIR